MKNKATLIAIPVLIAIAFLGLQSLFPEGHSRQVFFTVEIMTVKVLASIGCFVAASRYRRREYMGIAWQVIGVDYLLLFTKDILFGKVVHLPGIDPDTAESVRVGFVIAANIGGSIGCIMLARVWHVAGIALPGSRRLQYVAMVAGVAFAVAIVGWGTWNDLHNVRNTGSKEAMVAVASNLGDIVSFSAIAPILLTAIAMRGGALAWPWALVTLSNIGWLLYDMSWSFERQFALSEHTLRLVAEFFRAQGCAMALSAGLAQRWAIRSASRT